MKWNGDHWKMVDIHHVVNEHVLRLVYQYGITRICFKGGAFELVSLQRLLGDSIQICYYEMDKNGLCAFAAVRSRSGLEFKYQGAHNNNHA